MSSPESSNIFEKLSQKNICAIAIDAENMAGWILSGGLRAFCRQLNRSNLNVKYKRAYAVWGRPMVKALPSALQQLGFELIECKNPLNSKQATDFKLSIDAVDLAWRDDDIDVMVIASGDSHFLHLFQHLNQMGIGLIGAGPESKLSQTVMEFCLGYLYTTPSPEPKKAKTAKTEHSRTKSGSKWDKELRLLHKVLAGKGAFPLSELNEGGRFNYKQFGYGKIRPFLKGTKLVDLIQKNGQWFVRLKEAEKKTTGPVEQKNAKKKAPVPARTKVEIQAPVLCYRPSPPPPSQSELARRQVEQAMQM